MNIAPNNFRRFKYVVIRTISLDIILIINHARFILLVYLLTGNLVKNKKTASIIIIKF